MWSPNPDVIVDICDLVVLGLTSYIKKNATKVLFLHLYYAEMRKLKNLGNKTWTFSNSNKHKANFIIYKLMSLSIKQNQDLLQFSIKLPPDKTGRMFRFLRQLSARYLSILTQISPRHLRHLYNNTYDRTLPIRIIYQINYWSSDFQYHLSFKRNWNWCEQRPREGKIKPVWWTRFWLILMEIVNKDLSFHTIWENVHILEKLWKLLTTLTKNNAWFQPSLETE